MKKLNLLALGCLGLFACSSGASNNGNASSQFSNDTVQPEVVVFEQADIFGTWRFTIRTVEYDAEYDINGNLLSTTNSDLPSWIAVNADGAVSGKNIKSGGSGATIWTGTSTYTGQMADDKRSMKGTSLYVRTGTSGRSESNDTWTAVKIADGIPEVPPTPEELAAQATAEVFCNRYNECDPGLLQLVRGSVAVCIADMANYYNWQATLPDTGFSAESLATCAAAMQEQSCQERLSNLVAFEPCRPLGGRAIGESCVSAGQCESGYCDTPDFTCGVCAAMPAQGASCATDQQCPAGQSCAGHDHCFTPSREQGVCSDDEYCDWGFTCVNGTCLANASSVGAPCNPDVGNPYCTNDLICVTGTQNSCAQITYVQPGASCGWLGSTTVYSYCAANSKCSDPERGTCSATPQAGTACNDDEGTHCVWPDKCVAGACVEPPSFETACGGS